MARGLPTHDTRPWYRQFWPWFLIALPGSVVIAGLTTLYIANIHSDDLVVDNYYKDGLAINRQLEKNERAQHRGISARLKFFSSGGVSKVMVYITGQPEDQVLNLAMSHPLEADQDFLVHLQRIDSGVYSATLIRPVATRWHWTIESDGPAAWRLDGSVSRNDLGDEPAD